MPRKTEATQGPNQLYHPPTELELSCFSGMILPSSEYALYWFSKEAAGLRVWCAEIKPQSLVPHRPQRGAGTPVLQTGGPIPVPLAMHGGLPGLGICLAPLCDALAGQGYPLSCRTWRPSPAVAACVRCCGCRSGAGFAGLASLRVVAQKCLLHICWPLNSFSSGSRAAGGG